VVLERDGDLQFGGTGTLVVLFVQRDAGLPCGSEVEELGEPSSTRTGMQDDTAMGNIAARATSVI
jgi:hypothetical protein